MQSSRCIGFGDKDSLADVCLIAVCHSILPTVVPMLPCRRMWATTVPCLHPAMLARVLHLECKVAKRIPYSRQAVAASRHSQHFLLLAAGQRVFGGSATNRGDTCFCSCCEESEIPVPIWPTLYASRLFFRSSAYMIRETASFVRSSNS